MESLFQKHTSLNIKGIKELNNLLSCKSTQIRSLHSKSIHNEFFNNVLPKIEVLEPKQYINLVKSLSKKYRTKKQKSTESQLPAEVEADEADTETSPVKPIEKKNTKTIFKSKSASPIKQRQNTKASYDDETFKKLVATIKNILQEPEEE